MTTHVIDEVKNETKSLEEYRNFWDSLVEDKKKVRDHDPVMLSELVQRYDTSNGPCDPGLNVRSWENGKPSPETPVAILVAPEGGLSAEKLEDFKKRVGEHYPSDVSVVEVVLENGEKSAAIIGISAEEANAISALIQQEKEVREKLAAMEKQAQVEKAQTAENMMAVESSLMKSGALEKLTPNIQALVDDAMNPNVPTNPKDYANGKVTTPDMQNLAKAAAADLSLN